MKERYLEFNCLGSFSGIIIQFRGSDFRDNLIKSLTETCQPKLDLYERNFYLQDFKKKPRSTDILQLILSSQIKNLFPKCESLCFNENFLSHWNVTSRNLVGWSSRMILHRWSWTDPRCLLQVPGCWQQMMDPRDPGHQPLLHQRSLLLDPQEKKRWGPCSCLLCDMSVMSVMSTMLQMWWGVHINIQFSGASSIPTSARYHHIFIKHNISCQSQMWFLLLDKCFKKEGFLWQLYRGSTWF